MKQVNGSIATGRRSFRNYAEYFSIVTGPKTNAFTQSAATLGFEVNQPVRNDFTSNTEARGSANRNCAANCRDLHGVKDHRSNTTHSAV